MQISAATDSLTGLYNRRFFEGQCDKELNRALRYNQHLAIVMLDLHQFKEVNDRYGHPRGDALLRMAATTLRNSLRTSDYAFRIGGDEFALLLVQSDAEQAITLARRVRANFASATEPMQMAVSTGLDYGVAVYPNDGDQKEVLIRVADERLYEMKRSQRHPTSRREAVPPRRAPADSSDLSALPSGPAIPSPRCAGCQLRLRDLWGPSGANGNGCRSPERGLRAAHQVSRRTRRACWTWVTAAWRSRRSASESLAENFHAVLHVPILPPVRVSLREAL